MNYNFLIRNKLIKVSGKWVLIFVLAWTAITVSAQEQNIYGNLVKLYVTAPNNVSQNSQMKVIVTFSQFISTFPFNKNTDMSKEPIFPAIDGCDRLGEPLVRSSVSEIKNTQGKVTGKLYFTSFVYVLSPTKGGQHTIDGVHFTYRGHKLTAAPVTFTVEPKPSNDLTAKNEEGKVEEPIVYEKPFVNRKTEPNAFVNAIRVYADRTEVEISYTSKGENAYSSSNCFIRDTETKQTIKLRTIRGDVGFDKKYYGAGTKLNYTMIFPPMNKSWRSIDIVEDVPGGFIFLGLGLASKSNHDNISKIRGQINSVNWDNVRNVELNNYQSDFLFTDGLVPIYNKDVHKWGFFDEKGNQPIPFVWDYDDFRYPHFSGGYCIVSKVRKIEGFYYTDYYTINHSGQSVKLDGVEKVTPFCDGLATVVKKGGKYVYIKGDGQEVFPALARYIGSAEPRPARPFVSGLSAYYDYDKKRYGFINKQGRLLIPAIYEDVRNFSEELAAVKIPATNESAAKWGFINTKGEMVIAAQFSYEPSSFSMGCAVVQKRSGAMVMISDSGEVISPEFDYLFPFFSTGYTIANLKDQRDYYIIDNDYRVVTGPIYGIDYKHRNYIEHHGAFQIPVFGPGYTDSYTYLTTGENLFKDTSWRMLGKMSENLIHFKSDKGDGFIDYQGNVIFQFVESVF